MPFNPPPNWPTPPSGWRPRGNWRPDPSWPPAPPGWVFWTDEPPPQDPPTTNFRSPNRRTGASSGYQVPTDRFAPPAPGLAGAGPARRPAARWTAAVRNATAPVVRWVNPIRVGYALIALPGIVLFGWLFVILRFDARWTDGGWLWHGPWPVLGMLTGLAIGIGGTLGARRWDHLRWRRRRQVGHLTTG